MGSREEKVRKVITDNKIFSKWGGVVPKFATFFAFIYHLSVMLMFLGLKLYPMFCFNIFSVTIFALLLYFIPKMNSYIGLYLIAACEVIVHQILAEYYLGSQSNFHFFILLIGLLPYLVFGGNFKLSVPITVLTSILFICLNNANLPPQFIVSDSIMNIIEYSNVTLSVLMIIFIMFIFTFIVFQSEKELRKRNDMLANEIQRASVIQQSFFKQDLSGIRDWDVAYYNKTMVGVSGDLYDFYRTSNHLDGLGIFDVSGHGISSSLVTMLVKNIIYQEFYKNYGLELWEILNKINDRVINEKGNIENYLTGILVRIDVDFKIELVCAGHPEPILYKKSMDKCFFIQRNETSKGAIGIPGFPTFYNSQFVELEEGDEIVFYSDGAIDACNEEGEAYGRDRLIESVVRVAGEPAKNQVGFLTEYISDFCGENPQNDDITMIVLKK